MAEPTVVWRIVPKQRTSLAPSRSRGSICPPYPMKIPCFDPIFPASAIESQLGEVQMELRRCERYWSRMRWEDSSTVRKCAQNSTVLPLAGFALQASSRALQMSYCGCSWQCCWRGGLKRIEFADCDVEYSIRPLWLAASLELQLSTKTFAVKTLAYIIVSSIYSKFDNLLNWSFYYSKLGWGDQILEVTWYENELKFRAERASSWTPSNLDISVTQQFPRLP